MTKPPLHLVPSVHTDEEPSPAPLSVDLNEPPSMEEIQAMVEAAAWELRVVAGCAELSEPHLQGLYKLIDTIATLVQAIADTVEASNHLLESGTVNPQHHQLLTLGAEQNELLPIAHDLLSEIIRLRPPYRT